MESRTIETPAGNLQLIPAEADQLRGIARYWPMGIVAAGPQGPFGLVFQRGDEEVHGVKMQPADTAEADAVPLHHLNRALIAAALPHYLAKEHPGVMVPCAYVRKKDGGLVETGIAFFVAPDAASKSMMAADAPALYDDRLGDGASAMVFDMVQALRQASKASGLPLLRPIGMDLRPRLAMGGLAMHFAVEGPRVFVIKDPLQENELVWEFAVRAGFLELPYAPMKPAAMPEVPPAARG